MLSRSETFLALVVPKQSQIVRFTQDRQSEVLVVAMLDRDADIPFNSGERRQKVIENLLRRRAKLPTARTYLHPALFVAVIFLGPALDVNEDRIAIVAQVHFICLTRIRSGIADDA